MYIYSFSDSFPLGYYKILTRIPCSIQQVLVVYFIVVSICSSQTPNLFLLHQSRWCMHAKSLQSCATVCDPMDCIPPGSSVHGILQARILEWIAISLSLGSFQPRGIFPIQESNPPLLSLLHWRLVLYQLAQPGNPVPLVTIRLFSLSGNLSLVCKVIYVICQAPHVSDIMWCLSFSV